MCLLQISGHYSRIHKTHFYQAPFSYDITMGMLRGWVCVWVGCGVVVWSRSISIAVCTAWQFLLLVIYFHYSVTSFLFVKSAHILSVGYRSLAMNPFGLTCLFNPL